jgi:hypothetical protein
MASTSATGPAISSSVRRLRSASAGPAHRDGEEPRRFVQPRNPRPVVELRSPLHGRELPGAHQRLGSERPRRFEHPAAPVDHLGKALPALDQPAAGLSGQRPSCRQEPRHILRPEAQVLVEGMRQISAHPRVHEHPRAGQHDRHREGECRGDPYPDGDAAHRSSRSR